MDKLKSLTARWRLWAGIAISVALLLFFYRRLEPGELKGLPAEMHNEFAPATNVTR